MSFKEEVLANKEKAQNHATADRILNLMSAHRKDLAEIEIDFIKNGNTQL